MIEDEIQAEPVDEWDRQQDEMSDGSDSGTNNGDHEDNS